MKSKSCFSGAFRAAGWVIAMMALVSLVGCVTHAPASLVQPRPESPREGYAMLMLYCDNGGARGPSVLIDDTPTFNFRGDCYMWAYVRAGHHTLRTKWMWPLGGLNAQIDFKLEAGKNYYLKLLAGTQSNPVWVTIRSAMCWVPEETARRETATCWYRKPLVSQINTTREPPAKQSAVNR